MPIFASRTMISSFEVVPQIALAEPYQRRHGFWFLQAGKCYIVFNEFSLDWTYTRNFFHGFRMREQPNGI